MNSPCVNICTVDPQSGLCVGCGRTLEEIANWSSLTQSEQERIMLALAQRMAAAGLGPVSKTVKG
ncbi:MAG: DUF1289 domain-containing protein [Hyphomicrobiaceae bacterium]|nr:DUF1289 domain-containing protein [Hyphomicrobiaceae bacterium]MCC0010077.1 DUF1289 domain-containing protein [Hyphomicrobiaceae bacterium]